MSAYFLDVRALEPCEPLTQILAALSTLPIGEYLQVWHRMEPYPLYKILTQQGFCWQTHLSDGNIPVELFIWHKTDQQAAAVVSVRLR